MREQAGEEGCNGKRGRIEREEEESGGGETRL